MPVDKSERRIIYLQRREQGFCPRCGVKLRKGYKFSYCEDCRAFFRSYNNGISDSINKVRKDRYNLRKKKNQSPRYGKPLGKKYEKTICEECLAKQYKYNYGKDKVKKAAKVLSKKPAAKKTNTKKPVIKKAAVKKPIKKKAAVKKTKAKKAGSRKK
jgi:hypothetical protein